MTEPAVTDRQPSGNAETGSDAHAYTRARESVRRIAEWVAADFTPPRIVNEPSAPLAATWRYAVRGEQAPPDGIVRVLARGWAALIGIPGRCVGLWLAWIVERPSRTVAVFLLYLLVSHVGPGRHLPQIF